MRCRGTAFRVAVLLCVLLLNLWVDLPRESGSCSQVVLYVSVVPVNRAGCSYS